MFMSSKNNIVDKYVISDILSSTNLINKSMELALSIIQIISSLALITLIMIQNKSGGLSEAFGGGGSEVYHTKKGAEKFIFIGTIVFSIIFLSTALINLFF